MASVDEAKPLFAELNVHLMELIEGIEEQTRLAASGGEVEREAQMLAIHSRAQKAEAIRSRIEGVIYDGRNT